MSNDEINDYVTLRRASSLIADISFEQNDVPGLIQALQTIDAIDYMMSDN